jgi:hypothetical protein
MSSLVFDEGDRQRLEREVTLTEQLPRQPVVEDRSPVEDEELQIDSDMDVMLDGLLDALKRRL